MCIFVSQYDLSTLLAFSCIGATFVFVWLGIQESDSGKQANFFAVASFLFGFGTGMPTGQKLQTVKASNGDDDE
jgi:hypothetical protein